jgi:hypothetical protein
LGFFGGEKSPRRCRQPVRALRFRRSLSVKKARTRLRAAISRSIASTNPLEEHAAEIVIPQADTPEDARHARECFVFVSDGPKVTGMAYSLHSAPPPPEPSHASGHRTPDILSR